MITPSTSTQSLPPPLELRDDDRVVGWITGDTVRFRGFGSEQAAAQAATIAHTAMMRRLASRRRGTPSATEGDLGAVRRGSDRANTPVDDRPVAHVRRSHIDGVASSDSVAFEFAIRVPAPAGEVRMRGMAYVMYRAIRSSGIVWPLPHPITAGEPLPAMVTRPAVNAAGFSSAHDSGALNVIKRFLARASRARGTRSASSSSLVTSVPGP